MYQFVLAMVLAFTLGFRDESFAVFESGSRMLTGILKVLRLPPQCTFWRLLASLPVNVAGQVLRSSAACAAGVGGGARAVGRGDPGHRYDGAYAGSGQQMGARKSYNPKHKGKKELSADLTFLAETREYVAANCATGYRPTEPRSPAIWKVCLPLCRERCRPSVRARTQAFTVEKPCKLCPPGVRIYHLGA